MLWPPPLAPVATTLFCMRLPVLLDSRAPPRTLGLRGGDSFQANPPFVAELMTGMAHKIDRVLGQTSAAPVSFAVVVPAWQEDVGVQILSASPFKRLELAVSKADHGFCDGAQHQRRDRYRESPYHTLVFVLQNAAGAKRWPVTAALEEDLLKAFAMAKPTAAAIERRRKAGRGFADEDGGGGVYKGHRKNETGDGVVERRGSERKKKKKERKWQKKKQKTSADKA